LLEKPLYDPLITFQVAQVKKLVAMFVWKQETSLTLMFSRDVCDERH
jgi:hypothetical protein